MKKFYSQKLLITALLVLGSVTLKAQCNYTCGNYNVYSIPFSTVSTVGHNTLTSLSGIDDGTASFPIGFTFTFFCTPVTSGCICTNGWITLDATSCGYTNYSAVQMPNASYPNAVIAPFWNDLDTYNGGTITYATVGTAPNRQCIITYNNVENLCCSQVQWAQVVLYETTNNIAMYVGTTSGSTNTKVQGIENFAGTVSFSAPGRNYTSWNEAPGGDGYMYSPYTSAAPASISGISSTGSSTVLMCGGTELTYDVPNDPNALGYNWTLPSGWIGTSTLSSITTTATTSGVIYVSADYTCGTSPSTSVAITVIPAPTIAITNVYPQTICTGSSAIILVGGAQNYTLEPGGLITSAGIPFTVTPFATTDYTLFGTDASDCPSFNQPVTNVSVNPTPVITVNSGSICAGQGFTMEPSGGVNYTYTGSSNSPYVNPPAGIYDYTVNSTVDGCTGPPAICSLTVYSMPTTNAIATKTNVCKSDRITVFASGAQSYLWNTSATTSVTILNFSSYSGLTTFSVIGTNEGGCSKIATLQFNVNNCTGIEEQGANTNNLIVYPNPNKGEFTVELNNNGLEKNIALFDLIGRQIMTHKTGNDKLEFNINELNSGIYFLQVQSGTEKHTIKIVKE